MSNKPFWAWQLLGAMVLVALVAGAVHGDSLPAAAAENGKKYLYVREKTNRNDHPDIDRFLAYLGLPKGLSWCAAYVLFNWKEAAEAQGVKQPLPRYGRVAMLKKVCEQNPLKYRWIPAEQVRMGSVKLQKGDLPMWASGTIRNGDFNGHIGMTLEQFTLRSFQDIEGNTGPGNAGDQREGNGVYIRTRTIEGGNFRILGFCRVRQ